MAKLREQDNEKVKKDQTKWKAASMAKLREQDNEKVTKDQTNRKAASMAKSREQDNEKVKESLLSSDNVQIKCTAIHR